MNGLSPDLSGQFAIRNARVEIGDGRVLPEATVWVDKNRIKAVGPTAEVKLPDEVPVVQADGGVVTPGLIEIQSSLGLVVVGMESQAQDHRSGQGMHPGFQAIDGFDPFSLRIPIAREHGVTTAMIRPTGGIVSGMGTLIDLRPAAEVMEQAHGSYLFARVATRRNNRGEFWMKLREAFDDARLYQDYLRGEKKQPVAHQLSLKPVHLEALGHVLKGQAPIMLEAHRVSDIYAALRFLDEMKAQGHPLKMVILGGEEAWLAKEALAKAQVPVVVTPTKQMPYTLDRLRVRDDNPTLLARAGVDVVISSSDRNVRRLRQQAGRAVAFGMDYGDAIQAVTSTPARVLGLDDRGLIEPGKRADLVLWDGDPLQPQSTARKVWIKGEDQPLKNRQRTLSRRYATQKVAH
jgi:imidazolonepropionase-like amidohydrolase